jgi:hypothetical protein
MPGRSPIAAEHGRIHSENFSENRLENSPLAWYSNVRGENETDKTDFFLSGFFLH